MSAPAPAVTVTEAVHKHAALCVQQCVVTLQLSIRQCAVWPTHVLAMLLQSAPRENPDVIVDAKEVDLFRSYYSSLMYKVTTCAATGTAFAL